MDWTKDWPNTFISRLLGSSRVLWVLHKDTPDKIVLHFWIKRHNKLFDDFGVINGHWAKRYIQDCRGMWWGWNELTISRMWRELALWDDYPDICHVMQCSGKSCPLKALHASCHSLFFINRDDTFLQIMIRAREAEIYKKWWFNFSEMYPSFFEDFLFYGC